MNGQQLHTSLEWIPVGRRRACLIQLIPATIRIHRIHATRFRSMATAMLRRHADHRLIRSDVQRFRVLQILHGKDFQFVFDFRLPQLNDARLFGARQHRQLPYQTVHRRHVNDAHLFVQFRRYRVQGDVHETFRFREIQWLSGGCLHSLVHQLISARIQDELGAFHWIRIDFASVCGPIVVLAFPCRRHCFLVQERSVESCIYRWHIERTNRRSMNAIPVRVEMARKHSISSEPWKGTAGLTGTYSGVENVAYRTPSSAEYSTPCTSSK